MLAKQIEVTISDLHEYMEYIRVNKDKISLHEFLKLDQDERADLSKIKFTEKTKIDLTGANLSGCTLDGIEFNQYVILKNADLRGASIYECTFVDNIDLEGTKLGSVVLDTKVFKKCKLAHAEYDPSAAKIVMVDVTEKQLENYKKLRKEGQPVAQGSLNDYLAQVLRHNYPDDFTIVADLSERTIDGSYSNCDLTGSNLKFSTFTGEISNIVLRDCYFNQTAFEDCTLRGADLRGVCLSSFNHIGQEFVGALFRGEVIFDSPILSIDSNVELAIKHGVLPQGSSVEVITGKPLFDPCYKKGIDADEIKPSVKFSVEDVSAYISYCQQNKDNIGDFKSYICDRNKVDPQVIADLSGLDLRDLNLSGLNFEGCNFSYAKLSGSNLENAKFKNCNFSGADFSKKFGGWWRSAAFLVKAQFTDCDLSCADMSGVNASEARFENLVAINLNADSGFNLTNAVANNANFAGAWLYGLKAQALEAKQANLSYAFSKHADYSKANLSRANFSYGDFTSANFTDADLSYANFFDARLKRANLTRANLNQARLKAEIDEAQLINTTLENADLAGLFYEKESEPNIQGVDLSKAIDCKEKYQLKIIQAEQQKVRNARSVHNKYAFFIVAAIILTTLCALYFMPVSIAVALSYPLAIGVSLLIGAIAIDRMIENTGAKNLLKSFGINFSIVEGMNNFLGAGKVIALLNAPYDNEIKKCQEVITKDYTDTKNLDDKEIEQPIKHKSKAPAVQLADSQVSSTILSKASSAEGSKISTPDAVSKSILKSGDHPDKAVSRVKEN